MRLNLGCGQNKLDGFVNVDRQGAANPDVQHDLECFPWPFADQSVDEVLMSHVLEHLGRDPQVFIGIFRELYRVCKGGALIRIAVPHPRHDYFLGDPTHVRVVTPEVLSLFSKKNCAEWARTGAANSPLALYADVDFELRDARFIVERELADKPNVQDLIKHWFNVVQEIRMVLEVVKPGIRDQGSGLGEKTEAAEAA
jgi:SAM-dependent methyltransferase